MDSEPVYHAGMRELQDLRDTRRLADRLAAVTMHSTFTDEEFHNCPRYLHRMQLVEESVHVPRPVYTPPVPAWKTSEEFRDALPERDRVPAPE
jgi:hypothetical protein